MFSMNRKFTKVTALAHAEMKGHSGFNTERQEVWAANLFAGVCSNRRKPIFLVVDGPQWRVGAGKCQINVGIAACSAHSPSGVHLASFRRTLMAN
ncbi:MAG: hypothetical protein WA879_16145 [Candidatus Acidiferrales bacterium]